MKTFEHAKYYKEGRGNQTAAAFALEYAMKLSSVEADEKTIERLKTIIGKYPRFALLIHK